MGAESNAKHGTYQTRPKTTNRTHTIKRQSMGTKVMTKQSTELVDLRLELEQMFASAWQDGVHHLNPKYLRRDTFFTDRAMAAIESLILDAQIQLLKELQGSESYYIFSNIENRITELTALKGKV